MQMNRLGILKGGGGGVIGANLVGQNGLVSDNDIFPT